MTTGKKNVLVTAAILGALGVGLGAFGAHALKSMLEASGRSETYELAVRYQFYHALALLVVGILYDENQRAMRWAFFALLAGIILFSGSLYLLSLTSIGMWGAVTPFGGLSLIAGWILFIRALALAGKT